MNVFRNVIEYRNIDLTAFFYPFDLRFCLDHIMIRYDMAVKRIPLYLFVKSHMTAFIFTPALTPAQIVSS